MCRRLRVGAHAEGPVPGPGGGQGGGRAIAGRGHGPLGVCHAGRHGAGGQGLLRGVRVPERTAEERAGGQVKERGLADEATCSSVQLLQQAVSLHAPCAAAVSRSLIFLRSGLLSLRRHRCRRRALSRPTIAAVSSSHVHTLSLPLHPDLRTRVPASSSRPLLRPTLPPYLLLASLHPGLTTGPAMYSNESSRSSPFTTPSSSSCVNTPSL